MRTKCDSPSPSFVRTVSIRIAPAANRSNGDMETFLPPSSEWLNLQNSAAPPASLPHLSLPRYALQSTAASTQKRKAVVPAPPVEEFAGRVFRHTQKERMKETVLTNFASAAESLPERAAKSASSWNSSLLYARKQRGPQWDYGTRMSVATTNPLFCVLSRLRWCRYHVDSGSAEYYAGVVALPP